MKSLLLTGAIASIGCVGCDKERADKTAQTTKETTAVHRMISTPSGDWAGGIDYTYGQDGTLRHAFYEFRTFTGYDQDAEEFKPTKCVREYEVSEDGQLVLKSTVTTDLSTGEHVDRQFYEPKITHWMTIADARERIQAEQGGAQ